MRIDPSRESAKTDRTCRKPTPSTEPSAKAAAAGLHSPIDTNEADRVREDVARLVDPPRPQHADSIDARALRLATAAGSMGSELMQFVQANRFARPGVGDLPGDGATDGPGTGGAPGDPTEKYARRVREGIEAGVDPRKGIGDPAGIIGSSFGIRGSGSPIEGSHGTLPGGSGGGTNVHAEPGVGGRGPGRVEQASGVLDEIAEQAASSLADIADALEKNNAQRGEVKNRLDATSDPQEKAKLQNEMDALNDEHLSLGFKLQQQASKTSEYFRAARLTRSARSGGSNAAASLINRINPDPESVSGEMPAWLRELSEAAFGSPGMGTPEGVNEDHAGPAAPEPTAEESAASAEARIRGRQGELIQYGSEGGPAGPQDPDAPPPEEQDLGQGPENPTLPD